MNARAWILFLAVSVLWGIPYLLIKVAVEDLSPAVIVFARTGAGMILAATRLLRLRRHAGAAPSCVPAAGTLGVLAGLALIAVGSWLATRGPRAHRPEAQGLATS